MIDPLQKLLREKLEIGVVNKIAPLSYWKRMPRGCKGIDIQETI